MKIIFVLCNEPFRGAQDEVVSDGTLVIPQPMIRLNVLAAVPLIKKLFAKESEAPAQAQSKIGLLPLTPMMLLGGPTQSYTPTLHLRVMLKKANESGEGEQIFSGAFNTTENWRNFTQTIEIAKDKLADCEEGELILTWKNQGVDIPKVWIDELKVERSSLEVMTWADYYPYGLVMREGTCSSYRYQYQGETAEKDKETGWNHFELREYDPVIGRWLSTDPYGEFWSPYVGMGNDPVNNIDPDGGETDPPSTQSPGGKSSPSSGNIYMDGPYKKGFWSGFADGFGGGAMSTWNTIKGLATFDANTWKGLAQSTIDMASIVTMNPHGMMLANQYASSAISYAQNIPNMSSYEIGYGVGYGTEKITEVALLRYGGAYVGAATLRYGTIAKQNVLNKIQIFKSWQFTNSQNAHYFNSGNYLARIRNGTPTSYWLNNNFGNFLTRFTATFGYTKLNNGSNIIKSILFPFPVGKGMNGKFQWRVRVSIKPGGSKMHGSPWKWRYP